MPKTLAPTATQQTWMESHRCVICNGLPATVNSELVEEHRVLRPEYRYLATAGVPAEQWQTEVIGGKHLTTVRCENDHEFRCYHHVFFKEGS